MDSSRFLRGIIAVNRGSQPHQAEADMDATTVAVDLAKDVFEVALANRVHRIIDRKRLTRWQFGLNPGSPLPCTAFLFALSLRDPMTLAGVCVALFVTTAAGYLPARRAAAIDPARAIRNE
jgi:hypothetical protein